VYDSKYSLLNLNLNLNAIFNLSIWHYVIQQFCYTHPVYRPVKTGFLFSMKDRKPSAQSSDIWVRANWSMSAWLAVWLRALPYALIAALQRRTPLGGREAARRAISRAASTAVPSGTASSTKGVQNLGTYKSFSASVNVRFSPKTASCIFEITGNYIRWHMPFADFQEYVRISCEYQKRLGFSRVPLHKNRYSRLLMKNKILDQ
jgi:hypothetical protein